VLSCIFIWVSYIYLVSVTRFLHARMEITKKCSSVRLEVFMVVTMKNGVFWDVTPCGISSQHASVASDS
jgi:hypothetical protein